MYLQITEKAFKALDEDIAKQFKPADSDFEALEDTANKATAKKEEILTEKKALDAEKTRLEAELKTAKLKTGEGDVAKLEAQLEDATTKLAESEKALETERGNTTKMMVSAEANRIAAGLTEDTGKAKLLAKELEGRLRYENGEMIVLSEKGTPTVSKIESLAEDAKGLYPFLVDGTKSDGGGASKNEGGGAAEVKTIKRSAFDGMSQAERSAHFKAGGKVVNDD